MKCKDIYDTMIANDHFSRWLGIELLDIQETRCTISMVIQKDMLNGFGMLHGGVAYAFADSAFAFASNTCGRVTVSVEGSMNYYRSAGEGQRLFAEAYPLKTGNKISHYEVILYTETKEELYYKFSGIVYHTSKLFTDI